MTLKLLKNVRVEDIHDILESFKSEQKWDILQLMEEPLYH